MNGAPTHKKERERLEALRRYHILDTGPEKGFDDLTYLASALCKSSISLVTFIDRDRQWFKARMGIGVPQTSRHISFCAYTILQSTVLAIPDTAQDDRFRDNPWVADDPGVRFYAGAPIFSSDGLPLGTVCVFDREPRSLSVGQEESLRALSRLCSSLLEMRRLNGDLTDALDSLNMTSELLPACSSCRRLKDESGRWLVLEQYVREHTRSPESHGICPDCARKLYPDYIRS